jgi:hypothetical protein
MIIPLRARRTKGAGICPPRFVPQIFALFTAAFCFQAAASDGPARESTRPPSAEVNGVTSIPGKSPSDRNIDRQKAIPFPLPSNNSLDQAKPVETSPNSDDTPERKRIPEKKTAPPDLR